MVKTDFQLVYMNHDIERTSDKKMKRMVKVGIQNIKMYTIIWRCDDAIIW